MIHATVTWKGCNTVAHSHFLQGVELSQTSRRWTREQVSHVEDQAGD